MTEALEQRAAAPHPRGQPDPLLPYRVSVGCKASSGARREAEIYAGANDMSTSLRRLSIDLPLDGQRLSVVAYISRRLSARAVLAALVRWPPRDLLVLNVRWESLPCPDGYRCADMTAFTLVQRAVCRHRSRPSRAPQLLSLSGIQGENP